MRLFYILGLLFIFTVNSAFSQKDPDLIWSKWVGGPVQFSHDGKYVIGMEDQNIIRLNRENGKIIDTIGLGDYNVSPNGEFALKSNQLWNIAEKKLLYTFSDFILYKPVFSPDSRTLAFAILDLKNPLNPANPTINIWDISGNTILWSQKMPETTPPSSIQFVKGTDYLYTYDIASYGNIWNAKTGQFIKSTNDRQYSPNGAIYLSYINDSLVAFNAITEEKVTALPIGYTVTFSPQGRYVLFSNDDSVKAVKKITLWDIASAKAINYYESYRYSDSYLAFSPDSQYIAIATRYTTDLYRLNTATSVEEINQQTFHLSATPNPASAQSLITFTLLKESAVKLSVFDAVGQEVLKLFSSEGSLGENRFVWNTEDLPQGVYFIRLEADGKSAQVQCAVVR